MLFITAKCQKIEAIARKLEDKDLQGAKQIYDTFEFYEDAFIDVVDRSMRSDFRNTLIFVTKHLKSRRTCEALQFMSDYSRKQDWDTILLVHEAHLANCFGLMMKLSDTAKNLTLWVRNPLCMENKNYEGEYLYPSPNIHPFDESGWKEKGRAMTGVPGPDAPFWNRWRLIPQYESEDTYIVYNEGTRGFLNAYNLIQNKYRRDVFVKDPPQTWEVEFLTDKEITMKNNKYNEYLFAAYGSFSYSGEVGRNIFTWHDESDAGDKQVWVLEHSCQLKAVLA